MNDVELNALRNKDRQAEIRDFIQICNGKLALPLFLVFWISDLFYSPQLKWQFLFLRALIIPICLSTNFLIKRNQNSLLTTQVIGLVFAVLNAATITVMIQLSEGVSSPYYAGLNLIYFGINTFVPWTKTFLILNVPAVYGPFFLLCLFQRYTPKAFSALVVNTFFIVATIIISVVIRYFTERLRRRELESRIQLEDELTSREIIIRQKTKEAVQMATLTKQFSPQVVHSIRSGQIDSMEALHRANICAIFIDIVNSTDQVRSLELDRVNRVITLFMEDTMKVLLKYDITIDKFLGDGVLGFANDPVPHPDYVKRVVEAALEIKRRIASHQQDYTQDWMKEMQIRIGIAEGSASVGFYGSDQYVKSYTAIGRVINLASRLCSTAAINQIVVSEEVAQQLAKENYTVKPLGFQKLKGFSDEVKVFQISSPEERDTPSADIEMCPEGHGILHLDTDDKGIYFFSCRSCGYKLDSNNSGMAKIAA